MNHIKINNEGYCENCYVNNNCINCNIMNELIFTKNKVLIILSEEKTKKIKETNNNIPHCGECGNLMKKSKFKNGAKFWCSCKK